MLLSKVSNSNFCSWLQLLKGQRLRIACQGTILFQRLLVSEPHFHFLGKIDAVAGKGELDFKRIDSAVPV